jgi:hypothetical protein
MNAPPRLPLALSIRGRALVAPLQTQLPEVCVFTGGTEDLVRVKQRLTWHHPAIYLTVFWGLIIYVILALALRKTADVTYFMTRAEKKRRTIWHLCNWGIFLSTILWLVLGAATKWHWSYWVAPVSFLASIVCYFLNVRLLYPQKIDDHCAEIRGISKDVLGKLLPADALRPPKLA